MARYKANPEIEIEAEQWFPGKLVNGVVENKKEDRIIEHQGVMVPILVMIPPHIETLEGRMFVSPGDYVVTGIKGEKYAVKPDIFIKRWVPL